MLRRVLIVEDSTVMRTMLMRQVQSLAPVEIEEAADGVAALKAIRAAPEPFDLILLDLNMPLLDGMKLLGMLQKEYPGSESVIAVVTTEGSSATEEQARQLGARYYLRKPVKRRDLEPLIESLS